MLRITAVALLFLMANPAGASANVPDYGDFRIPGIGLWARVVTFGPKTAIPVGYFELCKSRNSVCRLTRTADQAAGLVQLTKRKFDQLAAVNSQVNRSIRPISDAAQYGVADRWSVSPAAGDCEDYALTKKKRLMAMGWPSSALLTALAVTWRGDQHAVLIVRTDQGDLVLDNLTPKIRGWSPSLYRWKSIQSPTQTWVWHQFGRGGTITRPHKAAGRDQLVAR